MKRSLASMVVVLVLAALLLRALPRVLALPEAAFGRVSLLRELAHRPAALCAIALTFGLGLAARRVRFSDLDSSRWLRWPFCAAALWLAWAHGAAPYDPYFERWHLIERGLLVAAAIGVCWRPAFAALLLVTVLPLRAQLEAALGSVSRAAEWPALQLVALLLALAFSARFSPRVREIAVPASIGTFAASYVWSGVDKLRLGWLGREQLGDALACSHAQGWLGDDLAGSLSRLLARGSVSNDALVGAALLLEVGALGLLFGPRIAPRVAGALVLFHCGVLLLTSIAFVPWVILLLTLLPLLCEPTGALTRWQGRGLACGVLLTAPLHLAPARIAWLDTPLCDSYTVGVTLRDGSTAVLAPADLGPYAELFAQQNLAFLSEERTLVGSFSEARDAATFDALAQLQHAEQLPELIGRLGAPRFEAARAARFDSLLRALLRPAAGEPGAWLRRVAAPPSQWTVPRGPPYSGAGAQRVVVRRVTRWLRDPTQTSQRENVVREVTLP